MVVVVWCDVMWWWEGLVVGGGGGGGGCYEVDVTVRMVNGQSTHIQSCNHALPKRSTMVYLLHVLSIIY